MHSDEVVIALADVRQFDDILSFGPSGRFSWKSYRCLHVKRVNEFLSIELWVA